MIPFHKVYFTNQELKYITDTVVNTHTYGDGPYAKKCEQILEQKFKVNRTLLTCSGTAALELAALLLDIKPGDEIIMPSFTFVSTANAVLLRGATPVFIDIHPDTLNMNEKLLSNAITEKTRGIIPVHYAGIGCEMNAIMDFAKENKIFVLEDAAHCYGAKYQGRALGSIGNLGMISFHQTKNIGCGEGGGLFINESHYIDRAEIIREKGTDRSKFLRGDVDKYSWCDIGSSFVLSDILAAFLLAQIEQADEIINMRKHIFSEYQNNLQSFAEQYELQLPFIPQNCEHNAHIFYILLPNKKIRDNLLGHLKNKSINALTHYVPLHNSKAGGKYGRSIGKLPITVDSADRILRLPLYAQMKDAEVIQVVDEIKYFFKEKV
jgi:dTDP-4-amino-4,6-dideoxygalactose transaminase